MIDYHRFRFSIRGYLFLLTLLCTAIAMPSAKAGTISGANDGTGTAISLQGDRFDITGGTTSGNNLFHSFQEFGISAEEIANFVSQQNIQNILGRVVGGNPSIIEGLIQVTGGNSNLYLMNPAGMVFGENASLNVPGDFTVTTATGIGFGNDRWFNAFGANNYSELQGIPFQLAFDNTQPAAILNQGNLSVNPGQSLTLMGGTVANAGSIEAIEGTITLAAVPGSSLIRIQQEGSLLSLEVAPKRDSHGEILPFTALDIPALLAASPTDTTLSEVERGDLIAIGEVRGENVYLAAVNPIQSDSTLIRTGDATQQSPTIMRFGEVGESWDYTFIDERADNPHELLYGGKAGTVSRLILREEDGIGKITEVLDFAENPVETVTIVAEGHSGELWLGKDFITTENLQEYRTQLESWGESLSPGAERSRSADILLYSCFTALGTVGESFVNQIAEATGADVAASLDATGSANYGGNWTLEYSTGNIATDTPFLDERLNNWQGKLATRTVTDFSNAGAFTLRDALTGSGGGFGSTPTAGDEIRFSTGGTINLISEINWSTDNLTIDGSGQNIVIDGGGGDRIFRTSADNVTIKNLTLQNGSTTGRGGGLYHTGTGTATIENSTFSNNSAGNRGGGIRSNNGAIAISDSTFNNNSATNSGGAVSSGSGNITIANGTIENNSAALNGGGVFSNGGNIAIADSTVTDNSTGGPGGGIRSLGGNITVTNSTVSGNSSSSYGGGISNNTGDITLSDSTVSGNSAGDRGGGISGLSGNTNLTNSTVSGNSSSDRGGGINSNTGDIVLVNSTVSGNFANDSGGGIRTQSGATIRNSTIAFNVADADNNGTGNGGGIYRNGTNNTFTIENSIIAQNSDPGGEGPDLGGTFDTIQNSLIQDITGATITLDTNNITGVDPQLLALTNNGGTTQTHALDANSPAIDAGDNSLVTTSTDQRGETRIVDGIVDMGAYEAVPVSVPSTAVTSTPTTNTSTLLSAGNQQQPNPSQEGSKTNNPQPTPSTITFDSAVDLVRSDSSSTVIIGPLTENSISASPAQVFDLFDKIFSDSFEKYFASGSPPGETVGAIDANNPEGGASGLPSSGGGAIANNSSSTAGSAIGANSPSFTSTGSAIADTSSSSTPTSEGSSSTSHASSSIAPSSSDSTETSESRTSEGNSSSSSDSTDFSNDANKGSGNSSSSSADGDGSEDELNLARAQASLEEVYRATGVKPALLYAIFVPPLGNSTSNTKESKNDRLFLMLVPPGGDPVIRPVPVNRELAIRTSDRFRNATINTRRPTSFLRPSQKLYDWLIAPIAEDLENLEIHHLTFLLDSGLRSLPVAALHDGEQFLVERYSLSLMPSMALTDLSYADVRGMS
ncbi:MAG: DUF4347 domain-containing protein, partial [Cyanobacteria bacterium SBLK]|nr:DUF4347 domain-containing protein [Cyanobacteria bacterium SBLK]